MKQYFEALIEEISKRATSEDVQELAEAVRTVSEQVEVCRQAIDQLTELLEHTVQNNSLENLLQEHANLILSAIEQMPAKKDEQKMLF